ncbi:hypothetical protein ACK280_26235 [Mycobacterium sherrisii]|uniref:hypothetical protein n=1 Tax=Mycobacterium sherrisii TaxID=243061 RepID=UPI00397473D8
MTVNDALIDAARTCSLHDVGGTNLLAATLIDSGGNVILAILAADRLDGVTALDMRRRNAEHEQLGRLPLDVVRKIAIAARKHRDAEEGGSPA